MTNTAPTAGQAFSGPTQSIRVTNPADTPLAMATARTRVTASPVATTAPLAPIAGVTDLVGQGGQQDRLARETHHPGSGTDW